MSENGNKTRGSSERVPRQKRNDMAAAALVIPVILVLGLLIYWGYQLQSEGRLVSDEAPVRDLLLIIGVFFVAGFVARVIWHRVRVGWGKMMKHSDTDDR